MLVGGQKYLSQLCREKNNNALEAVAASLAERVAPRDLGFQEVSPGDLGHRHSFTKVKWDSMRFGPDFVDPDNLLLSTTFSPAFATFKELFRCQCGAERVESVRGPI